MKRKPQRKLPPLAERKESIKADLLAGSLRSTLDRKYGVPYPVVKAIADGLGLPDNRGAHKSDRCGSMTKADVYRFHKAGVRHPEIADWAGVSRERIRQVVRDAGLVPRRVTQQERAKIRKAQRVKDSIKYHQEVARLKPIHAAARIKNRCDSMVKANKMWAKGDWMKVIAKDLGIPISSLGWHIGFCRKFGAKCGRPGMFPKRGNGNHGKGRRI